MLYWKQMEVLICPTESFAIMAVLVITMAGVLDEYDTMIATDYGLTMSGVGFWVAIRFIMAALGSYLAHHVRRIVERIFHINARFITIGLLSLLGAISLAAAGLLKSIPIMALYGLYYMLMSVTEVLYEDYIQQRIEDEGRSTVHSIISLVNNLYGILCFGILGLVLGVITLHGMLVVVACYCFAVTVILTIIYSCVKREALIGNNNSEKRAED